MTSPLHTTVLGESGPPVAFCHGLFGQGKNFTQFAKQLAATHRVVLVDMPNHGGSDWTEEFSYIGMADTVAEELRRLEPAEPWSLVGHSMGGKASMLLALRHPELVRRLMVVDISPVDYHGAATFVPFVTGMRAMPLEELTRRAQADELMQPYAPSRTVRSFLLQNLRRTESGFRWQMNLDLLGDSLDQLGGWPQQEIPAGQTYDGPVLWVAGAESDYVTDEYAPAMRELFPHVRLITVKGAAHWVHSQQPEVFSQILRRFLTA
ncbi:alpha/beta fold hydrolase [Dermacoccaceae bacterium W4C1]